MNSKKMNAQKMDSELLKATLATVLFAAFVLVVMMSIPAAHAYRDIMPL